MEALKIVCQNVILLENKRVMERSLSENEILRAWIIHLNTNRQLFDQGIDSYGTAMPPYRQSTFNIKQGVKIDGTTFSAGDHITLRDSGAWYNSFRVEVTPNYTEIVADPLKGKSEERFGDDVIGLTEESIELLGDAMLKEGLAEIVKDEILQGY